MTKQAPSPRVLIVEDSPTQAAKLQLTLEAEGFVVSVARDGQQGLDRFNESTFDLVVSDILMPGMDGYELCQRIKSRPGGKTVPVILLSTLSDPRDVIRCLECGADNFITKPFDPESLVERVRDVLEKRDHRLRADSGEGINLTLMGKPITITSAKEQIFDLLISSVEELARTRESEQAARSAAEAAERRWAFLAKSSDALTRTLDYEETIQSLARVAIPELGDLCIVYGVGDDEPFNVLAVAHVDPAREEALRELVLQYSLDPSEPDGPARVLRTGLPELVPEVDESFLETLAHDAQHLRMLREFGLHSYLSVPAGARDRVLAVISFAYTESGRRYDREDLSLAEEIAWRAALAIDNARLYMDAQQANHAKDEFLAMVSHDLRTPLNAMAGWVQLLRSGKLKGEQFDRALDALERNTAAQTQLIEDLLDVSRIASGTLRMSKRAIDLSSTVDAAVLGVRPLADSKGVTLEWYPAADLRVEGDAQRLQQVVWNLLTNAIKFTPKGGLVEVKLMRKGDDALVQVRDTGVGIDPEFLPHVFDKFRQETKAKSRKHGGLGLGLAIVRHIIDIHGGEVTAESEGENRGATFTIRLPVLDGAEPERPAAS